MTEHSVAILGAGAWGTALAVTLARGGRHVILCVRRAAQLQALTAEGENRTYLPGITLPAQLELSADWAGAVGRATVAIVAIPSAFVRQTLTVLAPRFRPNTVLVSATKGLEEHSLVTMTQALAELVPAARLAALSGPGFAMEIARGKPAALVAAAREEETAGIVQLLLAVPMLRVYRSTDVTGVELGGAVKNVIAIAAGISDGLELGSSARSALITRGLAEMMRLGSALGARRETLAGLSGLGDLVLTCTGELSRNHTYGLNLARKSSGAPLAGQVAEGVANARLIRDLSRRREVELPIVEAVCQCLYEDKPPQVMVKELFSRELKAEF